MCHPNVNYCGQTRMNQSVYFQLQRGILANNSTENADNAMQCNATRLNARCSTIVNIRFIYQSPFIAKYKFLWLWMSLRVINRVIHALSETEINGQALNFKSVMKGDPFVWYWYLYARVCVRAFKWERAFKITHTENIQLRKSFNSISENFLQLLWNWAAFNGIKNNSKYTTSEWKEIK